MSINDNDSMHHLLLENAASTRAVCTVQLCRAAYFYDLHDIIDNHGPCRNRTAVHLVKKNKIYI